jgi:hypothetical protein
MFKHMNMYDRTGAKRASVFLIFGLGFTINNAIMILLREKSTAKGLTRQARYIKIFMLYDYNEPTSPGARL